MPIIPKFKAEGTQILISLQKNYKNMKKSFLLILAAGLTMAATAAESAGWLRKSSISPDGSTIAFAYQGDIYTVPVSGGTAHQLTINSAYDSDPVWTPDGKEIVFSSYREQSKDIWAISAEGGSPRRLTTYTGSETPMAVTADGRVIFRSNIQVDPKFGDQAGDEQVYSVALSGGRVKMLYSLPVGNLSISRDGTILYEDIKGYEDPMRKHHVSSVTRDIWKVKDGSFTKLSTFVGENRNPVFAADGSTYYYLSEQSGTFNVWKASADQSAQPVQLTDFKTHPVRYISVADNGTICMSYNGDLYTMTEGSQPVKVNVKVVRDDVLRDKITKDISFGITDMAISPNGKEIAVIARGDVFVTSTEVKSTRRITNTPVQERGVSFSDDGRTLYYASERDGEWGIWRSSLKNKDDKYMSLGFDFEEERFSPEGQTCFQMSVSPDGKWVAYLRDRSELVIRSTKGNKEKVLLAKDINYSYQDGDIDYKWSPDSHYILTDYMGQGGWNNADVAMIDIESGEVTDLTRSGYSDGGFRWALDGKAMTWTSDKQGYRSHGSWGAQRDVYAMFFDAKAFRDFNRSKDEEKLEEFLTKDDKKKKKESKDSTDTKEKKIEKLLPDLDNIEDRTVRLTAISGAMGDHILSPDGNKLYYVMRLERSNDLCCMDMKDRSIKVVKKGFSGRFYPTADGKDVYYLGLLGVSKMNLSSGKTDRVSFSSEMDYSPSAERTYIFEHCWKQVKEKFYDVDIHGIDWKGFHDNYQKFLPYINNNFDFSEMLSEMLGELNGSHTGCRYQRSAEIATGHIGVLFDMDYEGKGLRIAEMLPGGMLGIAESKIKAGDIITAIDGRTIEAGEQWFDVFARKNGKDIQLNIKAEGGKNYTVRLKPNSSDSPLLYRRWVRQREHMVEKLSGGRIGYVHVEGMNSPSFREVYSKALGKYRNCDALIVDVRHNGGGWLHDDLATFLSGKVYVEWRPRGQYIGSEPYSKWTKPSCVLTCEDCYSDASGFPYTYRALGLGKIIGSPVPGTMTAVWWERQVDNSLVFGIPQVTGWAVAEDRPLENMQIEPDILVYNTPEAMISGRDLQIERAVEELMKNSK